jgi:hypothetical protein
MLKSLLEESRYLVSVVAASLIAFGHFGEKN